MRRWNNVMYNVTLSLNCLLVFLLLFESGLAIPAWLQVAGRVHPLVVHFPLVLVIAYCCVLLFSSPNFRAASFFQQFVNTLLIWAAFTAVIAALMGLLLSREAGYDPDAISLHKWTGAATAFLLLLIYSLPAGWKSPRFVRLPAALLMLLVIIATGHFGANITHGEDYVFAPFDPPKKVHQVSFDEAVVYNDLVYPILENKCVSCHNETKAKGELNMESFALLAKGGKNGVPWDTTNENLGLLLQRIHLPEDEKKHMPPAGKPQLTDLEKEILYAWVKSGAIPDAQVAALQPTDTLYSIAANLLKTGSEFYDFPPAEDKDILSLNNQNRVITPLFEGSPALVINFFNGQFYKPDDLKKLEPVRNQVVEINLMNIPVKDEDIPLLSNFTNLRKLNLSSTAITGKSIAVLKSLPKLRSLSLSDNPLAPHALDSLPAFPALRKLYVWNAEIDSNRINKLQEENKNVTYYSGFQGDTVVLKLTPPVSENETFILAGPEKLKLKNYITGTAIRYTLDGSEPDSLTSPLYDANATINTTQTVKARSFKPGWISSDIASFQFFKGSKTPDSIRLVTEPDPKYRANGKKSLTDRKKSEQNFADGKWLAYRENPMITEFYFSSSFTPEDVTISAMQDIGRYIVPPSRVEVWGQGKNRKQRLLGALTPVQPVKNAGGVTNLALKIQLKKAEVNMIKLIVKPVAALPKWHPGKGEKGWVFIDEVFFN